MPSAEILLGIMILIGLRKKQMLMILGIVIVIVTSGAGAFGLACSLGNVGGVMTLLAAQLGMLALQGKSCVSAMIIFVTVQFS